MNSLFLSSLFKVGLLTSIVFVFSLTTACDGGPESRTQTTTVTTTTKPVAGDDPAGGTNSPDGGLTPTTASIDTDTGPIACEINAIEPLIGCWKSICQLSLTKANTYVQLNSNYLANTRYELYINEHLASDCNDAPTKTYILPGYKTYSIGAEVLSTSGIPVNYLEHISTIDNITTIVATAYHSDVADNLCFAMGGLTWPDYEDATSSGGTGTTTDGGTTGGGTGTTTDGGTTGGTGTTTDGGTTGGTGTTTNGGTTGGTGTTTNGGTTGGTGTTTDGGTTGGTGTTTDGGTTGGSSDSDSDSSDSDLKFYIDPNNVITPEINFDPNVCMTRIQ